MVSATSLPAENKVYEAGFTAYGSSPHTELSAPNISDPTFNAVFNKLGLAEIPAAGLEFNQTLFGIIGLDIGGVYEFIPAYVGNKNLLSLETQTQRLYANARLQYKFGKITPFIGGGLNYSFWQTDAKITDEFLQLLGQSPIGGAKVTWTENPGLGWQAFGGLKAEIDKHFSLFGRAGYLSMTSGAVQTMTLAASGQEWKQDVSQQDVKLNRSGPFVDLGISFNF